MSTGNGNALRLLLFCTGSRLAADEDVSSGGGAVTGLDSIVDGDCATAGNEGAGSADDVVDDFVDDGTIESVVVVAVNAAADGVSPLSLILLLPALLVTASMSEPAPAIRAYTSSY